MTETRAAKMMRTFMAIAVALTGSIGLVAFTSSPAEAACSGGVCATSRLNVRHGPGFTKLFITVALSNRLVGISHYNVFVQCGGVVGTCGRQFESLGRFSFEINSARRFAYTIQACRRGGFLQRSECAPRPPARFVHPVAPRELRGSTSQG
ncbi:hypothetical protein [Bradyrhizobium prioriisuperbiae]|uniref:hypothetical protein n=1 Tax=Bradyrhizobium prioriisuperbiae TaxID=2854389 RepID=UPI0028EFE264|nr:hypothetical protein [Bradyrhizobium prioritasuperba]